LIVVDASAVCELLLRGPAGRQLLDLVLGPGASVHAPDLVNVEVLHFLRRIARDDAITSDRADEMRSDFADLPIHTYPTWSLLERAWALRENFTMYDAMYVALAEALGARLVTADRALARAACDHTSVRVEPAD
jgi:predicted nucleic acid-binding protein